MDTVDKMKIFVRVAELQSFTKTADSMNIPKATVSTSIQDLEASLNARLLQRTTRQVSLTPEGERYLERCQEILTDLDETQSMFRSRPEQMKGKIRVDMAAAMATGTFLPLLPKFLKQYPGLEVEVSCSDQTVDLVRDGLDCVIRSGAISQPGTIERHLGHIQFINCASPAYLKEFGTPKTLEDLKNHKLIFYTQILGGRRWGFEYYDGKEYREVKMQGALTVNNTDAYRTACLSGLGIAQIPAHGVRLYLKEGKLVEILPEFRAEPMPIKLVYHQRRHLAARVRTFMNWLESELKKSF